MAQRAPLSKRLIDSLKPPASDSVQVYDQSVPSLALRIRSSGVRTWIVYRRVAGRPERVVLGRYPELSPELARKKAAKVLAQIADGISPQELKRKSREVLTVGQLFAYGATMQAILEKARSCPPPKTAAEKYGAGSLRALLASICRELQTYHGDKPFPLTGRLVGPLLGVSDTQAWRWLNTLVADKILVVVKKYPPGCRLGTEYRYLGD